METWSVEKKDVVDVHGPETSETLILLVISHHAPMVWMGFVATDCAALALCIYTMYTVYEAFRLVGISLNDEVAARTIKKEI